jgi:5,10-methylenetetrahydrofolate reductase
VVRTVAAQLRSNEQLRRCLQQAAGVDAACRPLPGVQPANALLLVGGGHPFRRLPPLRRAHASAVDVIRTAREMQHAGLLPSELMLWAVANPLREADARGVEYLQAKIDAGADVVLTQPPLLTGPFDKWAVEVEKR